MSKINTIKQDALVTNGLVMKEGYYWRATHGELIGHLLLPVKANPSANQRGCYYRQFWVPRWKRRFATWTPPTKTSINPITLA